MEYREKLNNWAVVRLLPKMQRIVVERFRKESDADGYVKILRRLQPDSEFIVMFDPQPQTTNISAELETSKRLRDVH